MTEQAERARSESLWGLVVADALAMPVHWFYNPSDIKRFYGGWLRDYVAPTDHHPSSILNLSSVSE
jgi:ADP-ribosylglycohydrolase